MDEELKNAYDDYMHWCSECPKAYNFTCSGMQAQKCMVERNKQFQKKVENITETKLDKESL